MGWVDGPPFPVVSEGDVMENQPIRDPRILDALEACRPGSDDWADPSLAFLAAEFVAHPELEQIYGRLQRLDGKLAQTYRDVPVPECLAERIVARLEATRGRPLGSEESTAPAAAPTAESPAPTAVRRVSRRAIWAAVASVGTMAAAVLLVAILNRPGPVEITRETAVAEAIQHFGAQMSELDWRSSEVKSPSRYPFSREVLPVAHMRWAPLHGFLGRDGVVYEMVAANGTRAALYVVADAPANLPSLPPRLPAIFTAQRSASAWQSEGLLYVLVVDGSPQRYQQVLDIRRGPVT